MLRILLTLLALASIHSSKLLAFNLDQPVERNGEKVKEVFTVPYAFFSETTGLTFGGTVATIGYGQEQQALLANVIAGIDGSKALYLYSKDTQLPFFERLFLDSKLITASWKEIDSYRVGNPNFAADNSDPDKRAGANDSDQDNFITSDGEDDYYRFNFRYLLPVGDGGKTIIHRFSTQGGLLIAGSEAGGHSWNPLTSGRSILEAEFFYRQQDLKGEFGDSFEKTTQGITWALEYDNTDWVKNPSKGSLTRLEYARDWGGGDSDNSWSAVRLDISKYIDLGYTDTARQRVLALNFWTSDVPTWAKGNRPPVFAGSTLGGFDRLRAYQESRFNDRSAIYYAAEYRHVPSWNPWPEVPLINKLYIPWWQWVGFAEAGRVAGSYSLSTLHADMKWVIGGGIRAMVMGIVVRIDTAISEEGTGVQMTVGHPW
jgi:hypothetical protein